MGDVSGKLGSRAQYVGGEEFWQCRQSLKRETAQLIGILTKMVASGCHQSFHFCQLSFTRRNSLQ